MKESALPGLEPNDRRFRHRSGSSSREDDCLRPYCAWFIELRLRLFGLASTLLDTPPPSVRNGGGKILFERRDVTFTFAPARESLGTALPQVDMDTQKA